MNPLASFVQIDIPGYTVAAVVAVSAVVQVVAAVVGTKIGVYYIQREHETFKQEVRREFDEIKHDSGSTRAAVNVLTGEVAYIKGRINGRAT